MEEVTVEIHSDEPPALAQELLMRLASMGGLRHLPPESEQAQQAVRELQAFITEHYYTCTVPILEGLGRMYSEDAHFRTAIDRLGGIGTAAFIGKAIARFCRRHRA